VCHPEYPAYAEYSLICLQALACRTRFFLLSLSIRRMHLFISSFFGKKEERNEQLHKKNGYVTLNN